MEYFIGALIGVAIYAYSFDFPGSVVILDSL